MQSRFSSIAQLIGIILLAFILVFAIDHLLPEQPMQGSGNCQSGWVAKDESAPFGYDGDQIITKVIVKSGQSCIVFNNNGDNGCYQVSGIGSTRVRVTRIGEAGPECQEISHVEFYSQPEDTPTSTSTSTQVQPSDTPTVANTSTSTATATIPFKFWTPTPNTVTPTGTSMGTVTPTSETNTPTVPPDSSSTPPARKKSPTPEFFLPETGQDGSNDNDGVSIMFPAVFLGAILLAFAIGLLGKSKGGNGTNL